MDAILSLSSEDDLVLVQSDEWRCIDLWVTLVRYLNTNVKYSLSV